MKYEVDVETTEEATIQYVALVDADTPENAIKKVKSSIEEDGTAFMQHDCIETRVVDTIKIDKYNEFVNWDEGQDTAWVSRVHSDQKPRMAIVINNGTPVCIYSSKFKIGGLDVDVSIINFDTDVISAEKELESIEMDANMELIYSKKKEIR